MSIQNILNDTKDNGLLRLKLRIQYQKLNFEKIVDRDRYRMITSSPSFRPFPIESTTMLMKSDNTGLGFNFRCKRTGNEIN